MGLNCQRAIALFKWLINPCVYSLGLRVHTWHCALKYGRSEKTWKVVNTIAIFAVANDNPLTCFNKTLFSRFCQILLKLYSIIRCWVFATDSTGFWQFGLKYCDSTIVMNQKSFLKLDLEGSNENGCLIATHFHSVNFIGIPHKYPLYTKGWSNTYQFFGHQPIGKPAAYWLLQWNLVYKFLLAKGPMY